MLNSNVYTLLAVVAGTASAQHVTTAAILAPDWCVAQATPTVTVLGQARGLTTYSYLCPDNGVTRHHSRTQAYESRASDRSQRYESRASERSERYESRASARSEYYATRSHISRVTDAPCVPNPYTPYDDCEWQDGVPNDKREAKPEPKRVPCVPNPYTPYDDCEWQDGVPNDKDLPTSTRTRSTRTTRLSAIQTNDNVPCVPNPYTPYDDCEWQDGVPNDKRSLKPVERREDGECHGWHAQNDCVPWQVIQGDDVWAVHYSVEGVIRVDQQCTFGPGGVASGPALCTADGRVDPSVWGYANGPRTRTFSPSDVNKYFARNTAVVTLGGNGSAAATSGVHVNSNVASVSGGSAAPQQTQGAVAAQQAASTGAAAHLAIPTGVMAMAAGAGGILAAAIAL